MLMVTESNNNVYLKVAEKMKVTETDKMFKDIDKQGICKYIESIIEDVDLPIQQRIKSWIENTGSCNLIDETQPRKNAIVIDINTKYKTPKIKLYNLCSGKTAEVKIGAKLWREYKLERDSTGLGALEEGLISS